ncbi:unnamed protein product, partial [Gulo gulo]
TSTAPSLGRKGRVQPGPQLTRSPAQGGGTSGRRAARYRAGCWGLPHARGQDVGLGRLPRSWRALQGPRRRQVERVLSRGPGREPETRASWAPRGSTRGSSLPTALRLHEEEKCTGKTSDPSEVTQPGKVGGPGYLRSAMAPPPLCRLPRSLPPWLLLLLLSVALLGFQARAEPAAGSAVPAQSRPCVDCHAFEFMQRALQDLRKTAYSLDSRTEALLLQAERRALCACWPAGR